MIAERRKRIAAGEERLAQRRSRVEKATGVLACGK